MSISAVITLGYGQGVNFLPTLGYGAGAPSPPPTPTIRDQGAGHGHKKAFDSIDEYKKIGELIAQSKIQSTKTPKTKPNRSKAIYSLAELPKIITQIPQTAISLKEVDKLSITLEEIFLQEQEDEAIAFLMMATIH